MQKSRLNFILAIVLACFLVVVLFVRFSLKTYKAENFVGKSEQDILNWMEKESIPSDRVVLNYRYSDTVPENTVITQNLRSGASIPARNSLVVTISKGENPDERITLIDLSGMTKEEITAWLNDNGFIDYQFVTEINDDLEEGSFIKCSEKTGSRLKKDTPIIITLSEHDHSPTTPFPDFTGKSVNDIEQWAQKYNISVNYIYYYNNAPLDTFLYADFEPGTQIDKGGRISVAVSSGNAQQ